MKLTRREKILLLLLNIVVIGWGYYKFIITPQFEKMDSLKSDKQVFSSRLESYKEIASSGEELDNKLLDLTNGVDKVTRKYFPHIEQEEIIYIVNEFLKSNDLEVDSISFTQPSEEKMGELTLDKMSVTLPYKGKYSSLMAFLKKLRKYPKKIIISDVDMTNGEDDVLTGNIGLDFYSLGKVISTNDDIVSWNLEDEEQKENPFETVDGYKEMLNRPLDFDKDSITITMGQSKVLLEDFEDTNINYMATAREFKGDFNLDTNAKSNDFSYRMDYEHPIMEKEGRGYVLLDDKNLNIKKPPKAIGLWVYANKESNNNLGIRLKDLNGDKKIYYLTKGINWTGWKHLMVVPPQDKKLYPLQLDRITIDFEKEKEEGTILIDSLEAYYDLEIFKDPIDQYSGNYIHYEVQPEDTLKSISREFYNDTTKVGVIMRYNNLYNNKIQAGKILILPRNIEE
ncbi:LysM peptidoglycan-binding domain-containing protein [Dethiothermospora halolimnae]|uniref:LysM peptidoglycan-binding domain-containing protein n=1 Tax=Dethiothermospora halolimnae TaxID=3114390 RepID=UPI003CCBCCD9